MWFGVRVDDRVQKGCGWDKNTRTCQGDKASSLTDLGEMPFEDA